MKKISQREARQLKKRVEELESQNIARFTNWNRNYPGGVHILNIPVNVIERTATNVSGKLGFVLVAKLDYDESMLKIFAVKP